MQDSEVIEVISIAEGTIDTIIPLQKLDVCGVPKLVLYAGIQNFKRMTSCDGE